MSRIMVRKARIASVFFGVVAVVAAGCSRERGNDRWATTENTNVDINWDQVNEAYKLAEGPEDFERRVNEIYAGSEVISVSVRDQDDRSQVVTGFFDKNKNGAVEDEEKIFTIRREITGEGTAQMQTQGYGYYGYYHSPIMGIASGMILGSMLSSAFRPGYAPMYGRGYVTSPSRAQSLQTQRNAFRAANPTRFSQPKASGSGRSYGGTGRSSTPRSSGGTRFGIRRRERDGKPERLTA
jgi:hypothetical protein